MDWSEIVKAVVPLIFAMNSKMKAQAPHVADAIIKVEAMPPVLEADGKTTRPMTSEEKKIAAMDLLTKDVPKDAYKEVRHNAIDGIDLAVKVANFVRDHQVPPSIEDQKKLDAVKAEKAAADKKAADAKAAEEKKKAEADAKKKQEEQEKAAKAAHSPAPPTPPAPGGAGEANQPPSTK
jgi:colicin import membrane protein